MLRDAARSADSSRKALAERSIWSSSVRVRASSVSAWSARVVAADDLEVLYESRIQYNPLEATGEETRIPPDENYSFKNFDAIMEDIDHAMEGLEKSVVAVIEALIEDVDRH